MKTILEDQVAEPTVQTSDPDTTSPGGLPEAGAAETVDADLPQADPPEHHDPPIPETEPTSEDQDGCDGSVEAGDPHDNGRRNRTRTLSDTDVLHFLFEEKSKRDPRLGKHYYVPVYYALLGKLSHLEAMFVSELISLAKSASSSGRSPYYVQRIITARLGIVRQTLYNLRNRIQEMGLATFEDDEHAHHTKFTLLLKGFKEAFGLGREGVLDGVDEVPVNGDDRSAVVSPVNPVNTPPVNGVNRLPVNGVNTTCKPHSHHRVQRDKQKETTTTRTPSASPAAGRGGGGGSLRSAGAPPPAPPQELDHLTRCYSNALGVIKRHAGYGSVTSKELLEAQEFFLAAADKVAPDQSPWLVLEALMLLTISDHAKRRDYQDSTGGGQPYCFGALKALFDGKGNCRLFQRDEHGKRARMRTAKSDIERLHKVNPTLQNYFFDDDTHNVVKVAEHCKWSPDEIQSLSEALDPLWD